MTTLGKDKSDFIRSLADEHGFIEPAEVVAAARDPSSPIHDDFEWDTSKAAQAHWIEQARKLIRLVKVEFIVENKTYSAVAYVSDPERDKGSRRYLDITLASERRATARAILMSEMDRIAAAIRRAQEIAHVLKLTDELDDLLADVSKIRMHAEKAKARSSRSRKMHQRQRGRHRPEARESA